MIHSRSERNDASPERLADGDSREAEAIALAALAKKLRCTEEGGRVEEAVLTAISDTEITSREARGITLNSRHDIGFLKQRFPYRFCQNGSRRVAAFPRAEVEQYMRAYNNAEIIPDDYDGRPVTSFVTEVYPLAAVFGVVRNLDIPIRLYTRASGRLVTEYIDRDCIELLELGLAEIEPVNTEEDAWQTLSLKEQLDAVSSPTRGEHQYRTTISWDDDLIEIIHVPPCSKPVAAPWLRKFADTEALSWEPRYTRALGRAVDASVPLAQVAMRLGENATIALAAHWSGIASAHSAIGVDETGAPAVAVEFIEAVSALVESTEYSGLPIPDNWQTLEDIARDANVRLDGEGGLEAWVDEGSYGIEHAIMVPYRESGERRRLTFCSPQLARAIVDWVIRERQRLARAIELEVKYGRPGFEPVQSILPETSEPLESEDRDDERKEAEVDAVEELRAKLQSLERFAAQRSLEVQWVYELIRAKHDAYIVDYTANGQKQHAYFATTEGIEYLLENMAPPEYRTSRQICEAYDIPLYLFDTYASDVDPVGDFLSAEWSADVHPMPHYTVEQANHILSNYYGDVAEEPMRIVDLSAATGQGPLPIIDYLTRHGVNVDSNRAVLRQAGLRYIRERQEVGTADESLQTPTLFLMRTREVRSSGLTHAAVTAMCYELAIPLTMLYNATTKKTTQHVPTDRYPDLQAAVERYYRRSKA